MNLQLIQLLARKLSGEATPEELNELDQLLTHDPDSAYYAELITQLWEEEKIPGISRTITDTDMSYLRHLARRRPLFRQPAVPAEVPHRGQFRQPTVPVEVPPAYDLPAFPAKRRRIPQLAWLVPVALLTAGMLYFALSHRPAASARATDTNVEQYADLGSRRSLLLPDGTHVWLNAGSRIHYDPDMLQKDARVITLSGEAFFDVAKDKDRPFILHTSKIAIRVLGTAFNVKAYPLDRVTETTLMGGSIELTINSKPYQKIILKPKEKFDLIDETRDSLPAQPARPPTPNRSNREKMVVQDVVPVEVDDKEYVKEVSWIDDNFVFQNETLEELAPKMERWFNVRIHVDNARVGNLHYSGIFHKETIGQALTALQLIRPFNFKITDNHVFIH
jgi:transmembrane sensor